jgi:hypothetical protein
MPRIQSRISQQQFSPFGRTHPTRTAPKTEQQSPHRHSNTVYVPPSQLGPKIFHPRRPTVHTALSGLRPPQGSQKAIGASPPHGHSVHGFRPPSAQASPAFSPPSPHLSIWAGGVLWNKRVWISKWPPPLMRSLLSSSHVIKRASLTVSPGIPIIIANQCSGVHHLCGVVTIRASTSSPARAQDPITTSQVPPDESRYGGPGRSV